MDRTKQNQPIGPTRSVDTSGTALKVSNRVTALPMLLVDMVEEREGERVTVTERKYIETY